MTQPKYAPGEWPTFSQWQMSRPLIRANVTRRRFANLARAAGQVAAAFEPLAEAAAKVCAAFASIGGDRS